MWLKKILTDIFYLLILAFVLFLTAEIIKPGLISNSFDLNKLLIIIIAWGILTCAINGKLILKKYKKT